MKIRTKRTTHEKVMAKPRPRHRKPLHPSFLLHTLVRTLSIPELFKTKFTCTKVRMEEAGPGPWLVLMNHSSFIDLKIAFKLLYPRPFSIVCTTDAYIGKAALMRWLGCIPTQKFVHDLSLIRDMRHALQCNRASVLMYPEAGYSLDGRATALPGRMGKLLKMLDVPVVSIHTDGAFAYDPLYNNLQKRKVKVSAEMRCLLTRDEIREKSVGELDEILANAFTFDNFAWQRENGVEITEPFRTDGLNRILFRCRACGAEGEMEGRGTTLTCHACGKQWEMDTLGRLCADGEEIHIPDWYDWQRDEIRRAVTDGSYRLDTEVDIGMLVDYKSLYMVGEGRLVHDTDGFTLTGCDGQLEYRQSAIASHTLNSDYYWYEIGDVICIGDRDRLYYCFPRRKDVVSRARIAAEEIYTISRRAKAEARERTRTADGPKGE
ncbi:MAG: hypothetical protein IKL84_06570 [Clostridia bacterium]|nr:hypothetical protein [Clostridia bacterium]